MTSKILLIQSQYSYLEDVFYEQLLNVYPVDEFIEKIVKVLFNNSFDLVSVFKNYNNFDFERYKKNLNIILNNINLLQESIIKSNLGLEKKSLFNLLSLIYNCLIGDVNSLNQFDKCFFNKNALSVGYAKIKKIFIIPLSKRKFMDLSYKFINIISFLNGEEKFIVKGIGSFYSPLSSTTLLGEPNIISFLPDYEISLFLEKELNSFSDENYFNFLNLIEAKKNNLNIYQFNDHRVSPIIVRRERLLINKKDKEYSILSKFQNLNYKSKEIESFISELESSFRKNLELRNKEYDKLCSLLIYR